MRPAPHCLRHNHVCDSHRRRSMESAKDIGIVCPRIRFWQYFIKPVKRLALLALVR